MKALTVSFCSLLLSACATPTIISDTSTGNSIKYDPFFDKRGDIDQVAGELCARYGKNAVLIRSQNPTGIGFNLDNYECKE